MTRLPMAALLLALAAACACLPSAFALSDLSRHHLSPLSAGLASTGTHQTEVISSSDEGDDRIEGEASVSIVSKAALSDCEQQQQQQQQQQQ
eukprot:CAMPEP_0206577954 /NCGR_PEP_ID=MMETSP0325_2-20121206/31674_1 /ASSEMBLY_ACC=CAM_ASM_000347 /TAXON_ID=2866 /ORGANISM="Crypthecodinium cohnii, Strain Seligo" /LENGTH=91 /DNA_ID=CAMNT_0054083499 /DNA_START=196 /DNA_END=468 /DNA_ORIENTATION=+